MNNQPSNPQSQELLPCPFCGSKPCEYHPQHPDYPENGRLLRHSVNPKCILSDLNIWESSWNTRHTPTPPSFDTRSVLLKEAWANTSSELTPPLPDNFSKAIEKAELVKKQGGYPDKKISWTYYLSEETADTLLNAAKRSQELQERLSQIEAASGTDQKHLQFSLQLLTRAEKAEQQLRDKDALIEKLVEASNNLFNTLVAQANNRERPVGDYHKLIGDLQEALTDAHAQGFGKK